MLSVYKEPRRETRNSSLYQNKILVNRVNRREMDSVRRSFFLMVILNDNVYMAFSELLLQKLFFFNKILLKTFCFFLLFVESSVE